jgi:hypothetical protein
MCIAAFGLDATIETLAAAFLISQIHPAAIGQQGLWQYVTAMIARSAVDALAVYYSPPTVNSSAAHAVRFASVT